MRQKAGKNEILINKLRTYLENNYQRDLSLAEVASYVGYSTFYFTKLVKNAINMSFVDYLSQVRIKKAKQLFESTDMKIREVSYAVGYEDPNYFARVFKKLVGISPRTYKNSYRGQVLNL